MAVPSRPDRYPGRWFCRDPYSRRQNKNRARTGPEGLL